MGNGSRRGGGPRGASVPIGEDSAGVAMVAIPIGATLLIWFWVAQMSLFQNPASALTAIVVVTVFSTTMVATMEASRLRAGTVWTLAMCLLIWVFGLPQWLSLRALHGKKNLAVPGFIAAALMTGSAIYVGMLIQERQSEVSEARNKTLQELRRIQNELQP